MEPSGRLFPDVPLRGFGRHQFLRRRRRRFLQQSGRRTVAALVSGNANKKITNNIFVIFLLLCFISPTFIHEQNQYFRRIKVKEKNLYVIRTNNFVLGCHLASVLQSSRSHRHEEKRALSVRRGRTSSHKDGLEVEIRPFALVVHLVLRTREIRRARHKTALLCLP